MSLDCVLPAPPGRASWSHLSLLKVICLKGHMPLINQVQFGTWGSEIYVDVDERFTGAEEMSQKWRSETGPGASGMSSVQETGC